MRDITALFGTVYTPVKALLIYQQAGGEKNSYIESYDLDREGCPVNAHPLSIGEATALAKAIDSSGDLKRSFLKPQGLLPKNVLYINPDHNGYAVWHTPQRASALLFKDDLGIPCGTAHLPALLWKATKNSLYIYALKDGDDLTENNELYHAPFFNIYQDGLVCMGTVRVNIPAACALEDFIRLWENYFFNSYFSHLIQRNSPVKGNIVQLWQSLVNTKKAFPVKALIKQGRTIKNILS